VKAGKYHAKMVRRKSIKKPNGKKRPLGILVVDDKLLQTAVAQIFNAIYEQDFTKASYGYRPNRGAKEAIRDLTNEVREKYSYVVEADIQGFFDHIDHDWLMKMLDLRIGDGPVKKLIWKWLKAKVLEEDGLITRPIEGTPQGGLCKALHKPPNAK
jgi:retron-type reverse transcriptase